MSNKTDTAIHVENLTVFYGQTPAIEGVCLDIADKDYLGIIGPNGGGKSTLLKAILGLIPDANGEVLIYGKKFSRCKGFVGYIPQFSEFDKNFPITVREVVLTGLLNKGLSPFHRFSAENKKIADEMLERVGILSLAERQISQLSGGEFQKMLIARGLAVRPKLLLLDEPTASVDAKSREQIYNILSELNSDMTIVMVTHDLLAVASEVKTLACMSRKLVYHGEPELNDNIVQALYGCPVDLIAHGVPHRVLRTHNNQDNDCC